MTIKDPIIIKEQMASFEMADDILWYVKVIIIHYYVREWLFYIWICYKNFVEFSVAKLIWKGWHKDRKWADGTDCNNILTSGVISKVVNTWCIWFGLILFCIKKYSTSFNYFLQIEHSVLVGSIAYTWPGRWRLAIQYMGNTHTGIHDCELRLMKFKLAT